MRERRHPQGLKPHCFSAIYGAAEAAPLQNYSSILALQVLRVGGDALPEAGGEEGVTVAGEVLPLRVEGLELIGGHGGVLGGIEAASELAGHVGEAVEEGEALVGLDGEVEGEGDAGLGEAHKAGRGDVAEGLDDGEEAGEAGFGDLLEDGDGAFAGIVPGDDVLELEE